MLKACRAALHDAGLVAIRKSWRIKEAGSAAMVESHFLVSAPGLEPEGNTIEAKVVYPAILETGGLLTKRFLLL